jgi:hypothetical protein
MTAASGYDGPAPSIGLTGETSALVAAWSSRRPTFIGHLDSSPAASARLVRCIGARAGLFEPLICGEEAVGAVAVTWAQHRCRPPADVRRAVHGLLAHAAPVLARGARRAA